MTKPNESDQIKPKMKEAALLLATGKGPSEVATSLNISRTQLYEWRKNRHFNTLVQQETDVRLKMVRQELQASSITAARELINLMANAKSENVRLRACLTLLADIQEWRGWRLSGDKEHHHLIHTNDLLDALEAIGL
jgi:transposase-like protein